MDARYAFGRKASGESGVGATTEAGGEEKLGRICWAATYGDDEKRFTNRSERSATLANYGKRRTVGLLTRCWNMRVQRLYDNATTDEIP